MRISSSCLCSRAACTLSLLLLAWSRRYLVLFLSHPGLPKSLHVLSCPEAKKTGSVLRGSRAKVEFSGCRDDGKVDTASAGKSVFGAGVPDQAVETLIRILSLSCHTSAQQYRI
ncbi:hypothetical protein ACOMHN_048491 [Nucella lapillus]